MPENMHRQIKGKAAVLGIIVIAAGILLLGRNTGFLNPSVSRIIFSWEMLLIAIGTVNIFWRQSIWSGVLLMGLGGFFLLVNFYHMPFSTWQIFLPGLIIVIGLKMIFGHSKWERQAFKNRMYSHSETDESVFEDIAIFGGGERNIVTPEFKGGNTVAIFGGSKINLTHSSIAPNTKAVVELVAVFGGSTMIVPSDWNVKIEVFNIFGGFVDKRIAVQVDHSKTLVVKGVTIFGGGEIKSY
jgi:predicted membrane protein